MMISMSQMMGTTLLSSLLCFILLQQQMLMVAGAPSEARIISVPGFDSDLPSAHYGGYITVDEESERQLYYYFVTSERSTSATDPLLIWYNGGPGCSSFDGFIYEHGPFNFQPAANDSSLPTLTLNPYSWSKAANVLYVDSPAGVGFSYSKNTSDYVTGDLQTAIDSYTFIQNWFKAYPEYLPNSLFISGESYAGVYVPTLSMQVANGIAAGHEPKLNFQGYLVGNGVTDREYDDNAIIPFVHGMGLISEDLYQDAYKACGAGNYWNDTSTGCNTAYKAIDKVLYGLNIYDILEPCYHSARNSKSSVGSRGLPQSFRMLGEEKNGRTVRKRMFGRAWPLHLSVKTGRVPTWGMLGDVQVPCVDDRVASVWLNSPAVRTAIHAATINEIGLWELCTDKIRYYRNAGSMIPFHVNLTSSGYKALIYSGDHDMCVPFTGSEAWTRSLGYDIVDKWRPWFVNKQVAGFTQGYANQLTFATIKGSGHTVPEYKPEEALAFLSRFLYGAPL